MSLRSKIITAIVITGLFIIGTACWIVTQISLDSFLKLEQVFAEQDVQRVKESLQAEASDLEKSILSYSWWEETQSFVNQENPDFVEDLGTIFEEMSIHILLVTNLQGQVQYIHQRDTDQPALGLEQNLSGYLQGFPEEDTVMVDLMVFQQQPAFLIVAPILNNNGETPSMGRMVALRFLNQDFINELSQQTQLSLSYVLKNDQVTLKDEEQAAWNAGQAIFRTSGQVLESYIPFKSEDGNISFVIEIESTRDVYHQGQRTLTYLLLTLVIAGLVSLMVMYFLIYRIALRPLKWISQSVRTITLNPEDAKRIDWVSKDELGVLTQDINQMLAVMEENQQVIKRSNQELEQFAYVASHDLQEPLRKVQTFSERLSKKYAHVLDDDGKLYIERMQDASGRMRVLIQDLLSYSRVKSAGQELLAVDLNEVVCGVVADLEIRLEQSGGRVELETLPVIQGDPLQMRQVFQNLIGNALKFKKPDVAPVVKVSSHEISKDLFEITVIDNGIGFDNKYAERVFEVFQRLHGRSEYEGTGMGLAIVRKIIERHKGTICAESESGKGTSFILKLSGIHKNNPQPSQTIIKELV
jgi:signal transduction histidine kinase